MPEQSPGHVNIKLDVRVHGNQRHCPDMFLFRVSFSKFLDNGNTLFRLQNATKQRICLYEVTVDSVTGIRISRPNKYFIRCHGNK